MINIVFISDENYVLPTKVAIKSLIANKNEASKYNINIIGVELTEEGKRTFKNLEAKNASINIIEKTNDYKDLGEEHLYVSKSALFKFQIPNIFTNLDKILYLDSDVIVEKDLSDLYNTELGDKYVAAVKEFYKFQKDRILQVPNVKVYFNSGVMLLNLKKLREDSMPDKLLLYKKTDRSTSFVDQNAFNSVFNNNIILLEDKYNFMLHHMYFDENILNDICICHIAGSGKPWKNECRSYIMDKKFTKYCDNSDLLKINEIIVEKQKYLNSIEEEKEKEKKEKIEKKNDTMKSDCNNSGFKMNKLLVNLICCFIPKKKNRGHFRKKHLKCNTQNSDYIIEKLDKCFCKFENTIKNTNPSIRSFEGVGQTEIAYMHECYWANVFRDTIQNSEWLQNKSFSPGRYALSYIALYVLYRILDDIKPNNILECGLGQSSKMTIQYTDFYKKNLIIFENNKDWLEFFSLKFPTAKKYTHIYDLDYINIDPNEKSRVYTGFKSDLEGKKFDLIIVDGPLGSPKYSRAQLLNFLDYINPNNFIILLDDYNRLGEQQTFEKAKEILDSKGIKFLAGSYSSDKSIGVLVSTNYKFLLTL